MLKEVRSLDPVRHRYWHVRHLARTAGEEIAINVENWFADQGYRRRLVILDDIFPHLLSAFRIAEYNAYLAAYQNALVYSTAASFALIGEQRSFQEVVAEYVGCYPQFRGRARAIDERRSLQGQPAYFVFLQNARNFMSLLERYQMPFVFTLYPGGGFQLDQEDSDKTLERVCSLPNLHKVIVTQKITYEYLMHRQLLDPEKVEFIYGGVLPVGRLTERLPAKKHFRQDKDTFDICFVAYKYIPGAIDKGYDVFLAVAKLLANTHSDIRFHVVGPFDETDLDVSGLGGRLKFYGAQLTDFFPEFYSRMDIILSPNIPFLLQPGAFDGFPTGCCVEAALCGVAVFCTDPLHQNITFQEGEELVIIPRDATEISGIIDQYYHCPDDLYRLARCGQAAFQEVFALEAQMKPRLRILTECLVAK